MEFIKDFLMEVVKYLSQFGHLGIFIGMTLESACIPIPSELILPLAGYMVYLGNGSVYSMTAVGTLGCLVGSLIAYIVGYYGGRPFVKRYGKYFFMSERDFEKADRFFTKYGSITIFSSRMLPIIRTFISLPAGIAGMNIIKFSVLTVLGAFPWCLLFVYLGEKFGKDWDKVEVMFSNFNYIVAGLLILLIITYIIKKLTQKNNKYIFIKSRGESFKEVWRAYWKNDRLGIAFLIIILLLIILLVGFVRFVSLNINNGVITLDASVLNYIRSIRSANLTYVFKIITTAANPIYMISLTSIVCILLYTKSRVQSLYFAINITGIWGLNEAIKLVLRRQRPTGINLVDAAGYSFPSGHAMVSIVFGILLIYFIMLHWSHSKISVLLSFLILVFTLLIGLSRAYLGVHYMTDIVGGWLFGVIWSFIFIIIHRMILFKKHYI